MGTNQNWRAAPTALEYLKEIWFIYNLIVIQESMTAQMSDRKLKETQTQTIKTHLFIVVQLLSQTAGYVSLTGLSSDFFGACALM